MDARGPSAVTAEFRRGWMSALRSRLGGRCFSEVFLVGSHNAASHGIALDSALAPDAPGALQRLLANCCLRRKAQVQAAIWSRCQGAAVLEQLRWGVRYLDMRLAVKEAAGAAGFELWATHGLYSVPLAAVVADLQAFAAEAPAQEVVFADVQWLHGFSDVRHYAALVAAFEPLRGLMAHQPAAVEGGAEAGGPVGPVVGLHQALSKWWAAGARVIVTVGNSAQPGAAEDDGSGAVRSADDLRRRHAHFFSRHEAVRSAWLDQNEPRGLMAGIGKTIAAADADEQGRTGRPPLRVIQAILTPRAMNYVKSAFLPACAISAERLTDFAAAVNSEAIALWGGHRTAATDCPASEERLAELLRLPAEPMDEDPPDRGGCCGGCCGPPPEADVATAGTHAGLPAVPRFARARLRAAVAAAQEEARGEPAHRRRGFEHADARNVLMLDFIHDGRCPHTGLDALEMCTWLNLRQP